MFKKRLLFYSALLVMSLWMSAFYESRLWDCIVVGGALLLINKPMYLIPVYLISSLSSTQFLLTEGVSFSRILGIILIISGLLSFKLPTENIKNKNFKILICLFIFCLFSSFFSLTSSLSSVMIFAQYFAIVIVFSKLKNIDVLLLSKLLAISAVISIFALSFNMRNIFITMVNERLSSGEGVNANRFAMMVAQLGAIIAGSFFVFKRHFLHKIILITCLLISFYLIILSGSRSALIGLVMGVGSIALLLSINNLKKYIIPIILFVLISYFAIDILISLDLPVLKRFTVSHVENDGGSQRLEVWKMLIPYTLENNLFFGSGFGAENVYKLAKNFGLTHSAHNFIIDLFLQVGLIGFMFFTYYFLFVLSKIKSYFRFQKLLIFPTIMLLTSLFNGIGETMFTEKLFWNGIALVWLYIYNSNFKKNIQFEK